MPRNKQAFIIAVTPERVNAIRDALAAGGTDCVVFDNWPWGDEFSSEETPDLVVIEYELFAAISEDEVWRLSVALENASVPSVLVHGEVQRAAIQPLQTMGAFDQFLVWPCALSAMIELLNHTQPGIASVPAPPTASQTAIAALKLTQHDARVVTAIPSLSEGLLDTMPAPRLLYFLALQRRAGEVTFTHGDQHARFALQGGQLLLTSAHDSVHALEQVFRWSTGSYRFEWAQDIAQKHPDAQPRPLLKLLHDLLTETHALNARLNALGARPDSFPTYTTLLLSRERALRSLGDTIEIARRCRGRATLAEIVPKDRDARPAFAASLAFAMVTDLVLFRDSPSDAPVGLSYRILGRLDDLTTTTPPLQRPPTPPPSDAAGGFSRQRQQTVAQIKALPNTSGHLLAQLEGRLREAIEKSPYELFMVTPGCGRQAIDVAYKQHIKQHSTRLPENFPAPLRMTAQLLDAAQRDAYILLIAEEKRRAKAKREPDALATSATEQMLLRELQLQLTEIRSGNLHQLFGVTRGCGVDRVLASFDAQLARYAPDRLSPHASPQRRALTVKIFETLPAARDRLVALEKTQNSQLEDAIGEPALFDVMFDEIATSQTLHDTLGQLAQAEREHTLLSRPPTEAVLAGLSQPRDPSPRASRKDDLPPPPPRATTTPAPERPAAAVASQPRAPQRRAVQMRENTPTSRQAPPPPEPPPVGVPLGIMTRRPAKRRVAIVEKTSNTKHIQHSGASLTSRQKVPSKRPRRRVDSSPEQPMASFSRGRSASAPPADSEEEETSLFSHRSHGVSSSALPSDSSGAARFQSGAARFQSGAARFQSGAARGSSSSPTHDFITPPPPSIVAPPKPARVPRARSAATLVVSDNPKEAFEQGRKSLEQHDFALALRSFEAAHKLDPDNSLYLAHIGWSRFLCNPDDPESALKELRRAARDDNGAEMASFFIGTIAMRTNDLATARRYLTRALNANPQNRETQRALRLVKMRQSEQESSNPGGILGKLFKS